MTDTAYAPHDQVERSIGLAVDRLLAMQRTDGSWQGTLPSAAIATAAASVALHLGDPVGSAPLISAGMQWLRDTQNDDGGWGDAIDSLSTLNATAYAVGALHFIEPAESADQVKRGLECIDRFGGHAAIEDPDVCTLEIMCQQFLAFGGLYDEEKMRRLPMEFILLPRRLRQKISFTFPFVMCWALMQARTRRFGPLRRVINRIAQPRVLAYFDELHEFEGPDGGYQESPIMVSLACIAMARAGLRPDIVRRCVAYLRRTARADGAWSVNRDLEFTITSIVVHGLQDAGYGADPRLRAAETWMRRCQRDVPLPATGCPPGGWGWSLRCGWPDSDDTADALIALSRFGYDRGDQQVSGGLDWLRAMQSRNGSWACFCKNSPVGMDAPCTVMSAHAVTALQEAGGLTAADAPMEKALRWFAQTQRPDGSFTSMWYRGLTPGTGCVLGSLGLLGLADGPIARRCREWLFAHQDSDGGWGDGEGGPSTAEDTAWAVLGLVDAGDAGHAATQAGVRWLIDHQQPTGLWETTLIGRYFIDFMYSNDLLAAGYVVQALARYRQATAAARTEGAGRA
jgi:squalene-hopene/tetraprenyl-beta-curcumene cyclase